MKNWKWWAFLLVGTSLCLCAPTAFAAESAGLHTQLPGAELWQPYLDQSPVDALQVAEDPWSVLQSFCTSSLFQTLRESIRGYAALLLFLLLSAIVSLFLGRKVITAGVILSAPVGAGSSCGNHCLKLPGSCAPRSKAGTAFSPVFFRSMPVF